MELLRFHTLKKSRTVLPADVAFLKEIRSTWQKICQSPAGKFPHAYALAHVQVEDKDPMRAFVTHVGDIIMNPEILEQDEKVFHKEGCMTWPFRGIVKVRRYNKIKVKYEVLKVGKEEVETVTEDLVGLDAFIFQHEIGHFDLNTLYPPKKSQI